MPRAFVARYSYLAVGRGVSGRQLRYYHTQYLRRLRDVRFGYSNSPSRMWMETRWLRHPIYGMPLEGEKKKVRWHLINCILMHATRVERGRHALVTEDTCRATARHRRLEPRCVRSAAVRLLEPNGSDRPPRPASPAAGGGVTVLVHWIGTGHLAANPHLPLRAQPHDRYRAGADPWAP